MIKRFVGNLYIDNRWYAASGFVILLFITGFFVSMFWYIAVIAFLVFLLLTITDYILLFAGKRNIVAQRIIADRLNLGEANKITVSCLSNFPFPIQVRLIDEWPVQLQKRDFSQFFSMASGKNQSIQYQIRPVSRGEYAFGRLLFYVCSPLHLLQRRCIIAADTTVKVYPSTTYLKQYQVLALSDNNQLLGAKKIRRLGHSLEFEQIKEYVPGDDVRTINWKATARKGAMMVNNYIDARSQQIYCVIDKGRTMKMPFDGMSLLDYAINAALIFLNIALIKQDRAGIITFAGKVNDILAADRSSTQMNKINELLYRQATDFNDSNYEALTTHVFQKLNQRTFLLLFTNFETMVSLERQLPYLRKLASRHLVCVVLFQNTLLKEIHEGHTDSLEGIYIKTMADRFDFEKKQIVKELRRHGILSILTTPQGLTVDVVNKYLELKARQLV